MAVAELHVPISLGASYQLSVRHPGPIAGGDDFYVILHEVTGSNPIEKQETANNHLASAESLMITAIDQGPAAFIEGDLVDAGTDIDHFRVVVPKQSMAGKVSASCGAAAYGSGLEGLRVALLQDSGVAIAGAEAVEQGVTLAKVTAVDLPQQATQIVMKVSAQGRREDVAGIYYRCGLTFTKP